MQLPIPFGPFDVQCMLPARGEGSLAAFECDTAAMQCGIDGRTGSIIPRVLPRVSTKMNFKRGPEFWPRWIFDLAWVFLHASLLSQEGISDREARDAAIKFYDTHAAAHSRGRVEWWCGACRRVVMGVPDPSRGASVQRIFGCGT